MKILLFSRRGVVHAADELRRTFAAIERHGFDFAVNKEFADAIRALGVAPIPAGKEYDSEACPATEAQVMVCYGGDGTLLEGVRRLGGLRRPVLGINAGHLGFLTVAPNEGLDELFAALADGSLRFEERRLLHVAGDFVERPDVPLALNEFSLLRSGTGMLSVEAFVDDRLVATYHGDGVILATPTGSTAYALSAGGPVVAPSCACFVLAPLAPHNLTMRPVVVPDTSRLRLKIVGDRTEAFATLDNRTYPLPSEAEFRVELARQRIFLAVPHNISFYDTLRNKMMWGIDIRS